jgi:uncharacterized protein YegJ (DUF2314 family)
MHNDTASMNQRLQPQTVRNLPPRSHRDRRRLNQFGVAAVLPLLLIVHTAALLAATQVGQTVIAPVGPIAVTYVLHFAPEPRGDVAKQAQELLQSKFPTLKRLTRQDEVVTEPAVYVAVLNMKAKGLEPPSADSLKYFGRGVTREQAEAMQKSTVAAAVKFTYRTADVYTSLSQQSAVMKELASRTGGLIWDVETRELYTPEALGQRRLGPPDHGFPDLRDHITIHAYKDNEYVRAITLGMKKFGLPDIVIGEFAWSLNNQMGITINLFAQSLIEGATPTLGAYDFDVSKIKHAGLRAVYEKNLLDGAQPVALLTLANAIPEEGDPDNRLLELRFDRYAGKTVHEKHDKFAGTFYGSVDAVARVKHNGAILAASERARKRLPALRKAFNEGLEPGERILLKAPFERPTGGHEWMWVDVSSWKGDDIKGLLDNEPEGIPDLHGGATVKIREQDVFDYIRYKPDGTKEGNETGREIEKSRE